MIEGCCSRAAAAAAVTWRMGPVYFDQWTWGAGAVCVPVAMAEADNPYHPGQRCTVVRLAMLDGEGHVASYRDTSLSRLMERGMPTGQVLAKHREYFDVDVVQTRLAAELAAHVARRSRATTEVGR